MPSIVSLLLSLSGTALGGAVSRGTKNLGYIIVASVFLATAYIAGVAALAMYLAEHMSLWAAFAALAGGFIVAAGAALLAGSWQSRAADRRAKELEATTQDATLKALTEFAAEGSAHGLLAAAVAGLLAGGLLEAKRRRS
ncbi:MAG: hypothetical protein FP825_06660 [Hyphomonas sp.]|uniref:hypothetical protein n=1 Tax=Hyphomonas sp. TaxID=87 RepID=UPI0017AEF6C2|nr:hypothetical protein [Hyphomonas sp.]MBU3921705.1 hypothetical protein [Alphaproteobacteria bacterium]MBA3068141.1 hypothetical protein [Hyphomonas sp.]MBU4061124.1 hypothetical protein [Alphaproteobacteria bacterium]MBU4162848.1 hypothetical protein [Alphaproteobacteria bacterium]MBU4568166.1 hypothetical protein [Alphaproteobacteria bacterium]